MKRTLLIIVIALAISGLTMAARNSCSQMSEKCCAMGPDLPICKLMKNPEFVEKLGLTPEQIGKLKKIGFEHQKKMIALESNLKTLELELMNLVDTDKIDKNLIRQKVKEISVAKGDMALEKVDMKLAAADILSKEQIEKMKMMGRECKGKEVMKRIEVREGPMKMMKHKCMPGGGSMEEEDEMMMPPPPPDDEAGEEEE